MIMMNNTFSGKKALVVGGSGGIGKAVALGLAEKGAKLIIHGGSSKERLENTLAQIKKSSAEAQGFLLPINCEEDARKVFDFSPDIDILVCAWGPFFRGALNTIDEKDKTEKTWRAMSLNLTIPGVLVSLFLPGMIKKKWGRILLFGGTNTDTIRGYSTTAAYSAAKTGLGVIAKSVPKTLKNKPPETSVTCNVICPGLTDTEYLNEDALLYNLVNTTDKKPLKPEDIAAVCMIILNNPNINGVIIPVDKGLCL